MVVFVLGGSVMSARGPPLGLSLDTEAATLSPALRQAAPTHSAWWLLPQPPAARPCLSY